MAIVLGANMEDQVYLLGRNNPPLDNGPFDTWYSQRHQVPGFVLDFLNWPQAGHYAAYPNPHSPADNYTDFYQAQPGLPQGRGSVLYIKWQAGIDAAGSSYSASWDYQGYSHIIAGDFDPWLTGYAQDVANEKKRVLVSFASECNGNYFPWGFGTGGNPANTPALFIQAWRHIWNIFQAQGANQYAKWAWVVNLTTSGGTAYTSAYPGDAYVDWVGLDGYNEANVSFTQFRDLFSSDYAILTGLVGASKPLAIMEFGCRSQVSNPADPVGAQADWLSQMFELNGYTGTGLSLFPRVQALMYVDENQASFGDFRLSSGVGSVAVWQQAAADPRYQGVFSPDLSQAVSRSSLHAARSYTGRSYTGRSYTAAPVDTQHATITYPVP